MPRLTLLLILGLLTSSFAAGVVAHSLADLRSSASGCELDHNGPPTSEPSTDSGWEYDPNG